MVAKVRPSAKPKARMIAPAETSMWTMLYMIWARIDPLFSISMSVLSKRITEVKSPMAAAASVVRREAFILRVERRKWEGGVELPELGTTPQNSIAFWTTTALLALVGVAGALGLS